MFLTLNPSKQDLTWIYLDEILLMGIYLIMIEHFLWSKDDILGVGNNVLSS